MEKGVRKMNLNQIAMLQKFKSSIEQFRNNHPKFPLFVNAVAQDCLLYTSIYSQQKRNYKSDRKCNQRRQYKYRKMFFYRFFHLLTPHVWHCFPLTKAPSNLPELLLCPIYLSVVVWIRPTRLQPCIP